MSVTRLIRFVKMKQVIACLLALFGFLIALFYFWPGYLNWDALEQLREAQSGLFTDYHPPMMSILWRLTLTFYPDPGAFLLLQLLALWSALATWSILLTQRVHHRWQKCSAALIPLVGLYPSVLLQEGLLVKDISFAIALLWCWIFILAWWPRSWGWWVGISICFIYAATVRYNSMPALLPIILICIYRSTHSSFTHTRLRTGVCAIISILLALGLPFFLQRLTRSAVTSAPRYTEAETFLYDIVGIAVHRHIIPTVPPPVRRMEIPLEKIFSLYTPEASFPLMSGDSPLKHPTSHEGLSEVRQQWLSDISAYPLDYLYHRYLCALYLLGINESQHSELMREGSVPNQFGYINTRTSFRIALRRLGNTLATLGWLDGVVALILCMMIVLTGMVTREPHLHTSTVIGLGWSGLLYMLSQTLIGHGSDPRYIFWSWLVGLIGSVSIVCSLQVRSEIKKSILPKLR